MLARLKLFVIVGVASLIAFGFSMTVLNGNTSFAEGSDEGQKLFEANCMGCHSIGEGKRIGPDLIGVAKTRDRVWLTKMIIDPQALVDSGDKDVKKLVKDFGMVMPKIKLSDSETASIIAFLETKSSPNAGASQSAGNSQSGGASQGGAKQFTVFAFAFYGFLGTLILFVLADFVWLKRLRGVRKSLR